MAKLELRLAASRSAEELGPSSMNLSRRRQEIRDQTWAADLVMETTEANFPIGSTVTGVVDEELAHGFFFEIEATSVRGLVHLSNRAKHQLLWDQISIGCLVTGTVVKHQGSIFVDLLWVEAPE